jgi:hypothetical protein
LQIKGGIDMDNADILLRAKNHCFFIGLNDSGAELAKANTPYGIAGMHVVQQKLGLSPDATFISTPDLTITRNSTRWKSGFGYGGKISWGNGDDELVILNVKPNACGMLIGGLYSIPEIEKLIHTLHEMDKNPITIDGIEVKWHFQKSNHFIDIFHAKTIVKTGKEIPPYAFVIHGSANEFTADNPTGFGLYYDTSKELFSMARKVETPFSDFYVLEGNNAKKYLEKYTYADEFVRKKRRKAAELLFGDFVEISNITHQGLVNMNEILLGCHHITDSDSLFPLMLRGDLPAYLVKGKKNLAPETIELLGFEKRAQSLGVYHRLTNANVIPHGGGYVLPDLLTVNRIIEVDRERYFEVEMQNDRGKKIISDVRELPFEYRGRNVILRALEMGIVEIVAKLIPICVLKI